MDQKHMLLCITGQSEYIELIPRANEMAVEENMKLTVLCIQPKANRRLGMFEDLQKLFDVSNNMNAQMYVYYDDDEVNTLRQFIDMNQSGKIMLAGTFEKVMRFADMLKLEFPNIPLITDFLDKSKLMNPIGNNQIFLREAR